jgi:hypothetical protein
MYTSKDIAEAIEKIPADDLDATAIAWCDLHDRITRETGLSEEANACSGLKRCASSERGCSPGRWSRSPSIGRTKAPREIARPRPALQICDGQSYDRGGQYRAPKEAGGGIRQ